MNTNADDSLNPSKSLEPWKPVLIARFVTAWDNAIAAQLLLGERKKVERANDLKGAIRNCMREMCDEAAPFLQLVETAECTGFDYVMLDWNATQLAFRWGRKPEDGCIRRNDTHSTRMVQEQGVLFPGLDKRVNEVPLFTVAYEVLDDFTLGGVSQAWMGKLHLCREWYDNTEIIETIASFDAPTNRTIIDETVIAARIRARNDETAEMKRLVQMIRKQAG